MFSQDPCVRFLSPTAAELTLETCSPSTVEVVFCPDQGTSVRLESYEPSPRHRLLLTGLLPGKVYSYQLTITSNGKQHRSEKYTFDTTHNYAVASIGGSPAGGKPVEAEAGRQATAILATADVRKGYCLLAGNTSHELAFELARKSELIVIVLYDDPSMVAAARQWLYEWGAYGSRVIVQPVEPGGRLPLRGNFANLIVVDGPWADANELIRVLRPGSPVVFTEKADALPSAVKSGARSDGDFRLVRKEFPPGIGQWTHQYGTPANRASCGETLGGARGTEDLEVQWLGRPGADFGLDRNPRMPAPLSADGRLFHQGMNRVVALDAYNGAVLWNLEIPTLRRVNIPRDCGNWCVGDGRLYCALRNQLWKIDPQTGRVLDSFQLPDKDHRQTHTWGYTAESDGLIYGSSVKIGGMYGEFWGKTSWYDKQVPSATAMVCSDALFAINPENGQTSWTYRGGAIVNPTITIDHGRVYFAESRHADAVDSKAGRIPSETLWKDLHLVALDANTGRKLWQRKLDIECPRVVFFGLTDPKGVVLVSSANYKYHIYRFSPDDGTPLWQASHRWASDNHSGHMQHPVVVGDSLYLEPVGYNLADGKVIAAEIGKREGCHTYLGAAGALIYRGRGRQVSMWSLDEGSVTSWPGLRPSCWLSVIPAGGMLLVPEAGGGCSCGKWLDTSIGFAPWKVESKAGDNEEDAR